VKKFERSLSAGRILSLDNSEQEVGRLIDDEKSEEGTVNFVVYLILSNMVLFTVPSMI
jgi:hypothetical protein